jgi:anti-anti-sigma factor
MDITSSLYDGHHIGLGSQARFPWLSLKGQIMSNISACKAFRAVVARQAPDGRARQIIVLVKGEVDVATSAHLAAAIMRAMERQAEGKVDLVIDLTHLRFIDVSGINVLVRAARQARAAGGTLVLRSPNRAVRRLLDVLRLDAELAVE